MSTEKQFWQIDTEKLASELRRAASRSYTEEDFKMRAEPLIKKAFDNLGIDVEEVRYEKATGFRSKRVLADVVYGYLVIEYKAPRRLQQAATLRESKRQLERYLAGEAERYGIHKEDALEKTVGVSLDGEQILFARFSRTAQLLTPPVPALEAKQTDLFPQEVARPGFQFLGPYPVSAHSLANLLIYARAAARRPLTAQDLARVFGPSHTVAQQVVAELYSALMRAQRREGPSKVKAFFQEWDRLFGVVYGQELEKAERTAEETARLYQMPGGIRLKQFLFAIHTYYALLMKLIAVELLAMQQESTVEAFVAELPALDDTGFLRSRWCCAVIVVLLLDIYHLQVSPETVRRWLHREQLVWRRPRPVPAPTDPQREVKLKVSIMIFFLKRSFYFHIVQMIPEPKRNISEHPPSLRFLTARLMSS